MRVAPNGRPFFIDHNNHKTTWDDPRRRGKQPSRQDYKNVDELGPLPEGWEQVRKIKNIFISRPNSIGTSGLEK